MLPGSIFFEDRICAFTHHIVNCFHYIKHFLKRRGTCMRLHTKSKETRSFDWFYFPSFGFLKFFLWYFMRYLLAVSKAKPPDSFLPSQ
jgi:hypothetical protein